MKSVLFLFLLLLLNQFSAAQENCNNGIDDDHDGLIDLKDPDCACHINVTGNLLLNPSFESFSKCPAYQYQQDYNIIDNWLYALHTPDGEAADFYYHNFSCPRDSGIISFAYPEFKRLSGSNGFVDIKLSYSSLDEHISDKGYVSQCLQTPLLAGGSYTLSFHAGRFRSVTNNNFFPTSFVVAVFGHNDCNVVPMEGYTNGKGGCLMNYPGWVLLGKTTVFSNNTWIESKISLTIPKDINVIAIGPDCSMPVIDPSLPLNNADNQQYFLDQLQLLPTNDFHFLYIEKISGDICNGGYILKVPSKPFATYQWYKDSIAIPGATDSIYHVSGNSDANYNVKIITATGCVVSEPFTVGYSRLFAMKLPPDTFFCAGEPLKILNHYDNIVYTWNGHTDTSVNVTQPGLYTITASDTNGCSKSFTINVVAQNCVHCTALIPTAFSPNADGINDILIPHFSCAINSFQLQIYNRWGEMLFESNNISRGWDGTYMNKKVPVGVYVYFIRYQTASGIYKTGKGTVAVIR